MATLAVNGKTYVFDVASDMPLLLALRDELGLTQTKSACGIAQCANHTATVPATTNNQITPVEGFLTSGKLHPACLAENAPECAYYGARQKAMGAMCYYRFPELGNEWGGPFNGQDARTALFLTLHQRLAPAAIIETGTYRGTTTELLAACGCPVYSVEQSAFDYGFAVARLHKWRNVTLIRGDSRETIYRLLGGPLRGLLGSTVFFYLDAHWGHSPLIDELSIIFDRCPAAVVMVDDFEVPGDPDYSFDDYGQGTALNANYIAAVIASYGLAAFYPATPAAGETGERRGCVVLARNAAHGTAFSSVSLLRKADSAEE